MKNYKNYDYVIIVDRERGCPVAWAGEQLCFCTNQNYQDEVFPVKAYKKTTANKYVLATANFRRNNGWDIPEFDFYPIKK